MVTSSSALRPSATTTTLSLTEVGMLPEGWRVQKLGELLSSRPDYGINAPAVAYDPRHPSYIRITDITDDGRFNPQGRVSVSHVDAHAYKLASGDIVLARTGASTGKSYLYRPDDGELIFAGFLIRIHPDPQKLLPSYLTFQLQTAAYWNWVRTNSMRSGQPGINGQQYASMPVPVPPTKVEQQTIADALSDVDSVIDSLETLFAKKSAIKQGAMQELLSGHKRLPGFTKRWEEKKLGALGSFLKGNGIRKDQAQSGDLPCIRYGEIYTEHNDVLRIFRSFISREVAASATRVRKGDVLFAGSGETKEEIGKCVALLDDIEAYAGGDIVILRTTRADPAYLGYALNAPSIQRQKASRGQGDAVVHISAAALASIDLLLPEPEEQVEVGRFILAMDQELAELNARLTKARQIKQGMMQELLTGRVRLV